MAKGNRKNHPLKYARAEDLKELKDAFYHFKENAFMHLVHKVDFTNIKLNFLLGFIGLVLALLAILITKLL